jgi:EvpB/VC_A0108, tail sheath N-terminal domain
MENVRIRVLDCSKQRLFRDLDHAVEFDQSLFFKKVYEDEFAMLGGEPFGCLVFNNWINQKPEDLALVEKLSSVAVAAAVPIFVGIDPGRHREQTVPSARCPPVRSIRSSLVNVSGSFEQIAQQPSGVGLGTTRSPSRRRTTSIIVCAPAWGKGRPPGEYAS